MHVSSSSGNKLDISQTGQASVQFGTTFFTVGGHGTQTSVLEYKPDEDKFIEITGALQNPRTDHHGAALISFDDYCG